MLTPVDAAASAASATGRIDIALAGGSRAIVDREVDATALTRASDPGLARLPATARSRKEGRPLFHQHPSPLEQVGPAIGGFHPV